MSRIGKLAITIPSGTEVGVQSGEIVVKGKGGTLKRILHPAVSVTVEGGKVSVVPAQTTRLARALWGTYAAHVRNMIAGVNQPFTKRLQVEGIGFRAELAPPAAGRAGQQLKLQVGFSHPVMIDIPAGITATVEKNIISISGPDKEVVGGFAAGVRAIKKPEPYKGKGIRYEGEVVRQKQGKKAATAAA
ncbi:MAG: 50S ribosomal protein L6 [Patescibacteria group bacterium]